MTLDIHFTDEEIIRYLIENGYTIKNIEGASERHVHGSRYIAYTYCDRQAIKNGVARPYKHVFRELIKNKLLSI